MGDAAKISPHVPSTLSLRSVGSWEDMILQGFEDPHNCMDPRNLGKSEWEQKLGKIECVFSLYDKMRWKWDAVYLLRGLPNIYYASLIPPVSLYTYRRSLTIYLEAVIELVCRCTWRPRSSELRDALGGRDRVNWELHLEAMIERVWRCTWRPRSNELRAALGGHDRSSLEMHWEDVIEWVWRCTWRPRSSELSDALGGHDRSSLEAVIERVWRCTGKPWSSEFGDCTRC